MANVIELSEFIAAKQQKEQPKAKPAAYGITHAQSPLGLRIDGITLNTSQVELCGEEVLGGVIVRKSDTFEFKKTDKVSVGLPKGYGLLVVTHHDPMIVGTVGNRIRERVEEAGKATIVDFVFGKSPHGVILADPDKKRFIRVKLTPRGIIDQESFDENQGRKIFGMAVTTQNIEPQIARLRRPITREESLRRIQKLREHYRNSR